MKSPDQSGKREVRYKTYFSNYMIVSGVAIATKINQNTRFITDDFYKKNCKVGGRTPNSWDLLRTREN